MDSTNEKNEVGSVFIFGCGAVGTALAVRFISAGIPVVGAHCRSAASAARASRRTGLDVTYGEVAPAKVRDASLITVSVPDPLIGAAADQLVRDGVLGDDQVVLHCSGARNADELDVLRPIVRGVGSFHPLISFADPSIAARHLPTGAFAIEGDEAAVAAAEALVGAMGGRLLRVEAEDRVLYHAAAAMASNHLAALAAQAITCFGALGIARHEATQALVPLMQSTLDNIRRLGLPEALTGPVSRGDRACVEGHLLGIEARAEEELLPYVVMALRALSVAREQGVAEPAALSSVGSLLEAWFEEIANRRA